MIQTVWVRHSDDHTAVRVGGIKPFHPKKMDLYIFESDNRVRVRSHLTVCFFESEVLIESDGFVKFSAR
jgi:hypothetical protein